jgi:hypothetical protein
LPEKPVPVQAWAVHVADEVPQFVDATLTVSVTTKDFPGLTGKLPETVTWLAVHVTLPLGAVAFVMVTPEVTDAFSELIEEFPVGVSFVNVSRYWVPVEPAFTDAGTVRLKIFSGAAPLGAAQATPTVAAVTMIRIARARPPRMVSSWFDEWRAG